MICRTCASRWTRRSAAPLRLVVRQKREAMTSNTERTGRPPDFEVRYRFLTAEEGGRRTGPPLQGYRSDWSYEGDDVAEGIYMIWPEFLAEDGSLFPENVPVSVTGHASMWIVSHDMRTRVHRLRIHEGIKGYFMEGGLKVAEAIVTRVIALHTNSDANQSKKAEHVPPGGRGEAPRP